MSKVGASSLRRTLFLVMSVYLQNAPLDEPVYQFMDKKRAEGKPYHVYMMVSANKFLQIYYVTVKAYLESLEHTMAGRRFLRCEAAWFGVAFLRTTLPWNFCLTFLSRS